LKEPIVIFGTGEIVELANFYFTHDSDLGVAGFTADDTYLTGKEFRGRPSLPLSALVKSFHPSVSAFSWQ
jgi:hypothetical protein